MNAWVVQQQRQLLLMGAVAAQQQQQQLAVNATATATAIVSRQFCCRPITANKFECECALKIVARLVI